MPTYLLTMVAAVDADNESAARQCFIDGDWGDISLTAVDRVHTETCDLDEDCSCDDEPDPIDSFERMLWLATTPPPDTYMDGGRLRRDV